MTKEGTQWQSVAQWPDTVSLGSTDNESRDYHTSEAAALAVVNMLKREGFGGERKVFPIIAYVLPPTPPTPAGAGTETPRTDRHRDTLLDAFGRYHRGEAYLTDFQAYLIMVFRDVAHIERELTSLRRQAEADREELNQVLTGNEPGNIPWLHEQKDKLLRAVMHLTAQLATADKDRERKPRRRLQLSLNLGADNRDELLRALDQIVLEMQMGHLWGDSCSGGCGSGYYMNVSEDESITHESYFAAIAALQPSPSLDQGGTGAKQP